MKIKPIILGLPSKEGVSLNISILTRDIEQSNCALYYAVKSESGEILTDGNISLNEEQYGAWNNSNDFLINLVLTELGLELEEDS